jgi:3-oxoacyl-[acyl-carrier-protein] synthase III
MLRTAFLGLGHFVPDNIVSNSDLAILMDTSDEWIQRRTGIETRRHVDFKNQPMGTSDLGARAGEAALRAANVSKDEIDLIICCTLSAEKQFPGDAVLVQAKMDIPAGVPALDIRNQCSGFLYGLSIANAFVQTGVYKRILLIGSEVHSTGLDFTTRGRDVTVLFGDGAAAAVLGPTDNPNRGILSVHLHADGRFAGDLECSYPASGTMPRITPEIIEQGLHYPKMNGKGVFKHAVVRMPEAVTEALVQHNLTVGDIDLLVPHQANLRINEMVAHKLELGPERVFNNIQKYGNTTAASIPLALSEAVSEGKLKAGDLLCLCSFGSGFTWGSALIRW